MKNINNMFNEIPNKIKDIRNHLSNNIDMLQDIIQDIQPEETEEEEEDSEGNLHLYSNVFPNILSFYIKNSLTITLINDISNTEESSEGEADESDPNIIESRESEPKEIADSDLILETVEEEENIASQRKDVEKPKQSSFLNISTNFGSHALRNAHSINKKLPVVERLQGMNRSASKRL